MASDVILLPKDPEALAQVLEDHGTRCEQYYLARRTTWLLAWYYLNGYRRFSIFDPTTGKLSAHLLDEEGNMEFQSQQLLYDINQVAGRIQSMDCRLRVETSQLSLGGLRDRAIGQIVGDACTSEQQVLDVTSEFGWLFACLGFAGLTGHIADHPTIGLTADIEVIHPKQLFPFPTVSEDFTGVRGLMRQRWVPLSYLKNIFGARKINNKLDDLDWYETDPGENPDLQDSIVSQPTYWGGAHSGTFAGGPPMKTASTPKDRYTQFSKIREVWTFGAHKLVQRYAITSGSVVLGDQDLSGKEAYCPIGYARFFNNGSFHGAGMFDMMFSQHRQLELLQKSLYNNIRDLDRYGVLVLPQGQFNQNNLLRDVGRGLRVMFWEPDPVSEGFNPFPIAPANAGEMPGRVAQFAREAMSALNPIQDLIQEKGRVDSASGLQYLDEQITRALTSPTTGVVQAWGTMYKSVLQRATQQLAAYPRPMPVSSLTLDLLGVLIDPADMTVSFTENPLPRLSSLRCTIREASPRSPLARKQEALDLFQRQIDVDPLNFRLFALKESLDFAMWLDEDKGAYESGVLICLLLYGDGKENRQVVLTPHTTKPEIVARLANVVINSPYMLHASPEIVNDFGMLRDTLLNYMGLTLPNAIPNPDDAAMLSMNGMTPNGMPMLPPGGSPPTSGGPGGPPPR